MNNEKPKKHIPLNRVICHPFSEEINPEYVDWQEKRIEELERREVEWNSMQRHERSRVIYWKEKITKLREALERYNTEPYRTENGSCFDVGEIARIALKETEEG